MVIEVKMIEIKNAQGGEGVTNNPVGCEEKINDELEKVLQTFRKAIESAEKNNGKIIINENEEYGDIYEWLDSYALAYEDDPHYRGKKLLLSTGGPEDFFLFFEDGDIEYHYLDWYDGAYRVLHGEDYKLMKRFYEEVLNI